jgi:caa(3)-type oxidase subunit IV
MADSHGNPVPDYLKVFFALCAFTVLTVVAAKAWHTPPEWGTPGDILHVAIGVVIAVLKVIMVMYMHLKFDNPLLRITVYVPVFLFIVMSFALGFLEDFNYIK